jgi:acylphosphatase
MVAFAAGGHCSRRRDYNQGFMIVGKRFLVSGRVQGVGFRYFARDAALREGIRGTAQNLDDGRVEVIACGDAEAMGRFELAVRRGPAGARVEHVQVEPGPPGSGSPDFRILP